MTASVPVRVAGRRYHPHLHAEHVDADALERALRQVVRGEVRFDRGSRAVYSTDSSNFRQVPIGVVVPLDVEDVVAAVAACRDHGAPITTRGGGTSLAGQTTNVAVILDFSKHLDRVLELNPDESWARVQPGCVLDTLRTAAEKHGLTFGPDPSTHNRCTLGGMIGNNSCGAHSVLAGRTSDNVLELDVLLYDGTRLTVGQATEEELGTVIAAGGRRAELYAALMDLRDRYAEQIRARFPSLPRRVSGFGLDELLPENNFNVASALTGTEGTCVIVLEAKLRLVPSPPARSLLVLGYPSLADAADDVRRVMSHGPIALEAIDQTLIDHMKQKGLRIQDLSLLPKGESYLLVEFGGPTTELADQRAAEVMKLLEADEYPTPTMSLFDDQHQEQQLWEVRESGLGATARVPGEPDAWPGWEDAGVPVDQLGDYLRAFRALLDEMGIAGAIYGHFSQGCVHCRLAFDLQTADGIAQYRAFLDRAADLVVDHGGSLSGEHGDGQQRAALLERMFGGELVDAFREFKAIWDPTDRMNPGKVVDPVRVFGVDENLRLGADYRPWRPATHFAFPDDDGSFDRAVLRCVGVGLCRREDSGLMCPSFMGTNEEEHSTRGRSRVLFEMLQGEVIDQGWRSREVAEALDLCLSCKGCKQECPVNVDMATYKAEFLSHHYARRLRPRAAYSLGLIMYAARAASAAPRTVNALLGAPGIGRALKRAAGVAPERAAPKFASTTFRSWFVSQGARDTGKPRVLLYPDTFTNFFEADQGKAAVEVLGRAGFDVAIPPARLCCGRPLYDYGMLPTAKRLLRRNLEILRPELTAGTPIVVLEPSCAAVFRDELRGLFPHDPDARRLERQVVTLAELLVARAPDAIPRLDRDVLLWEHCHHRSVLGTDAEHEVLQRTGVRWSTPNATCCGLAGSWGFEAEKYDLSMTIGEQGFFSAARDASPETVIVADGFSCRTQLRHGTSREGIHLAQLLAG